MQRTTILYAAVFLGSGIVLLALTYLMSGGEVTSIAPGGGLPASGTDLTAAEQQVLDLERTLAAVHTQRDRQLLVGALIALWVMAGLSLLLGRALAVRVLRPLREIAATTRRISAENLHRRLAVAGPDDEIKELADTVDDLLERLEASFVAQRRFAGNAAHELRTPLTTMRASLDVAVAKPEPSTQTVVLADRLRTELDRVDLLLDGLLVLARAQHGLPADRTPVSLTGAVRESLAARILDVAAKDLTVQDDARPAVVTRGSPALLARMVENIVDNAITHNEDGGWIRASTTDDGVEACVVVESGGRVLDQDEVDLLTRPFERLGADRTGPEGSSGLGLSIVAAIVAAHGGRLALVARPEGGLRVTAALPSTAGREA